MYKFAVYIDTENFSDMAAIAAAIRLFNGAGEVSVCEAHGHYRPENWTNQFLRDNNITDKFAPASSRGKNSADMAILVEAMDTIGKGFFAVCVMSGDGDFNPLAEKIKKNAMEFWGVGEQKKASLAFQKACSAFFFKEDLEKPVAEQRLKDIISAKLRESDQAPKSAATASAKLSPIAAKIAPHLLQTAKEKERMPYGALAEQAGIPMGDLFDKFSPLDEINAQSHEAASVLLSILAVGKGAMPGIPFFRKAKADWGKDVDPDDEDSRKQFFHAECRRVYQAALAGRLDFFCGRGRAVSNKFVSPRNLLWGEISRGIYFPIPSFLCKRSERVDWTLSSLPIIACKFFNLLSDTEY